MESTKVDMFLAQNSKKLPADKIYLIKDKLASVDDSRFMVISSVELKDPTTITIISVLLGSLGIDRFMIGNIGLGILKLLTMGLCGVMTIIDWFLIGKKTREVNFNELMKVL
ncbi:TM2 domain-containing protein [Treponema rectale]|uniref:TM2 domain-containing protein n=1 Tax=Treponema rectale TaxID=744512 RepID=A0A840SGM9_9SPIR|nr:TM2 domain-containing protein [Treponema rectale]MBB5219318.1 hypothetical protein [Treponema rectale]QOS40798.1 TM2 domain-containing protein [Treponema rectale]